MTKVTKVTKMIKIYKKNYFKKYPYYLMYSKTTLDRYFQKKDFGPFIKNGQKQLKKNEELRPNWLKIKKIKKFLKEDSPQKLPPSIGYLFYTIKINIFKKKGFRAFSSKIRNHTQNDLKRVQKGQK